jgi:hypothetical protein
LLLLRVYVLRRLHWLLFLLLLLLLLLLLWPSILLLLLLLVVRQLGELLLLFLLNAWQSNECQLPDQDCLLPCASCQSHSQQTAASHLRHKRHVAAKQPVRVLSEFESLVKPLFVRIAACG